MSDYKADAWSLSFLNSYDRLSERNFIVEGDSPYITSAINIAQEHSAGLGLPNTIEELQEYALPRLREVQDSAYLTKRENLFRRLYADDMQRQAAWHLSCGSGMGTKGANEWMFSLFNKDMKYRLTSEEYREALKSRLLLKSFGDIRKCKCGTDGSQRMVSPSSDPYHPILCRQSQGVMNSRHLAIQTPFLDFLREVAPGTQSTRNPTLPGQAEGVPQRSSDLLLLLPSGEIYVDFCVATPSAVSYLAPDVDQLNNGRACTMRIKNKESHYKRAMQLNPEDALDPAYRFFALDATGRISIEAMEIIDLICGTNVANFKPDPHVTAAKRRLYMRLSVICARAIASAMRFWRSRTACINNIGVLDGYPVADFDLFGA